MAKRTTGTMRLRVAEIQSHKNNKEFWNGLSAHEREIEEAEMANILWRLDVYNQRPEVKARNKKYQEDKKAEQKRVAEATRALFAQFKKNR